MWPGSKAVREVLVAQLVQKSGSYFGEERALLRRIFTNRYTHCNDFSLVRDAPQLVCLSKDIPQQHAVATNSGHIIVRNADGTLCGLENRCAHRGAELIAPEQPPKRLQSSILTCPYHAWSFDLTGKVRKAPSIEKGGISLCSLDQTERDQIKLKTIRVMEKWGAVWTTRTKHDNSEKADEETMTAVIDECFLKLGDKPSSLNVHDNTIENFSDNSFRPKTIDKAKIIVDANWKLCIETFLESDHVGTLHKNTLGKVAAGLDHRAGMVIPLDDKAQNQVVITPLTSIRPRDSSQHLSACATILVFAFPHNAVVINPNFVVYLTHRPLDARRTEINFLATAQPGCSDDVAKRDFRAILAGAQEDYDCVAGIQRGIDRHCSKDDNDDSFLLSPLEPGLNRFLRAVDDYSDEAQ